MRVRVSTISKFILLGLLICGCQKIKPWQRKSYPLPQEPYVVDVDGRYGSVFVASIYQEPKTFNPVASFDAYSNMAQKLLFGTLLEYDYETQNLKSGLATQWQVNEDQKTYTITLRKGVFWSDGTPFSVDDVMFTFDALLSQTTDEKGKKRFRYPSMFSSHFKYGEELLQYHKVDDCTIRFFTPHISAAFIHYLSELAILPKHKLQGAFEKGTLLQQWSLQTAIEHPDEVVGLGPFIIYSYRPGERLVLVPNPHFWKVDRKNQRLPYLDYYITQFVPSMTMQTILFATGQTDGAQILPADIGWVERMQKIHDFTIHFRGPDSAFSCLWLNQNPGQDSHQKPYVVPYKLKWFRDQRFRQAIAHAINREGLIQSRFFGLGECIHSFIARADFWYNPMVKKYHYDVELAKKILKESGFYWNREDKLYDSEGHPVEIEVSWATAGTDTFITMFKENMAKIGINVKILFLDFNALIERVQHTYQYEVACIGFTSARDPSGAELLVKSDGANHIWYPCQQSPSTDWEREIDELFEKQEQTLNKVERKAYVDRMQYILSEQVPMIGLITPYHYTGIKNKWKNLKIPKRGSIIWNIEEIWCD